MTTVAQLRRSMSLPEFLGWRRHYLKTGFVPAVQRQAMAIITARIANFMRGKGVAAVQPRDCMLPQPRNTKSSADQLVDAAEQFMSAIS